MREPCGKSLSSTFCLEIFLAQAPTINFLLRLRISAYSHAYALVKVSLSSVEFLRLRFVCNKGLVHRGVAWQMSIEHKNCLSVTTVTTDKIRLMFCMGKRLLKVSETEFSFISLILYSNFKFLKNRRLS